MAILGLMLLCITDDGRAATYHVASTGLDGSARNGSISQPWKTLSYAATRAIAIGDLIKIGPGTYEESAMTSLKPGVSLEGAGESQTTITSIASPTGNLKSWLITMGSWNADIPVAGNQSVSHMTLDGRSHSVNQAIGCYARSGVTFHHLTIRDCALGALGITGSYTPLLAANAQWPDNPPPDTAYCSNILIHDCTFLNSGYSPPPPTNWAYGALGISGVKDSVIRNCSFDEREYGGWGIKGSWFKNSNIHNCSVLLAPTDPVRGKDFSIEIWYVENSQFYDIWANGTFSIGMNKNVRIHHNEIVMQPGEGKTYAVEFGGDDSSVDHNWFDAATGVVVWGGPFHNSRIEHNVFRKCDSAIFVRSGGGGGVSNLHIHNNTLDQCGERYNSGPIGLNTQEPFPITGSQIRNNIIVNTAVYQQAVELGGINTNSDLYSENISGTTITNNLYFNNAHGDFHQTASVVGTVSSPNLVANPLFKGGSNPAPSPYYELQAGSPAKGTGADVGLPYLGNSPDLGAFVQPIGQRIEAGMNFSIATDVGVNGPVIVDNLNLDSDKSVRISDSGDTIRVHFKVLTAGYHDVAARVRSGAWTVVSNSNHNPSGYFNGGYSCRIDGVDASFQGDASSISPPDSSGGGIYWGTMFSRNVYLTAGLHHVEIAAISAWGLVDWLEVSGPIAPPATYTWTGSTTGNWSDSTKWDANGVPDSHISNSNVILHPGAFTLTETVNGAWNTTGSGSIRSLTLQSGTNTMANGLASTNLTIGAAGFTNNSGNNATINFNTVTGGTITTSGSQTWALNAQNLGFHGNLAAANAADVLTLDTGTSNAKTILFSGGYATPYAGTLHVKNTAGTLNNTLTFDTARAGSFDRAAKLLIDNNNTLQNFTLNFNGAGLNNTVACDIEFKNFVATTNNRLLMQTNMGGGLYGHAFNTLNFTGNLSGTLSAKTAGGSESSVLYIANSGAYVLSGDNSALTIDNNDVAHGRFLFSLRGGGLVANSPTALGLDNALGIGVGDWNANVPKCDSGLFATPAAGTINANVWLPTNNYINGQLKSQPGYGIVGLPPTAANTDSVTFNGNILAQSFGGHRQSVRLVTGLGNDGSHGGTAIFNGAIQDSAASSGSNPLNPLTESSPGVIYHGAGTCQINGVNTYVGKTTIRAGTVLLGGDAPSAAPVIVNNAVAAGAGATTLTLSNVTGLNVGLPLSNAVANVAPGTRITAIDGNVITLSLPTTGSIGANVKLAVGGGVLGAATSAVSLGDGVPSLVTVKAATFGNTYPANGTWSAGDGVTTFTRWTFGNSSQAGTLDGQALVTGDTVLVKDCFLDTNRNGVYLVDTSARTWTRVVTLDSSAELLANLGMRVHVTNGTQNANKDFYLLPVSTTASWIIDSVASTTVAGFAPQIFAPDVSNPTVALLTNGAYTVARDIDVTDNQSTGNTILGGNTAHASTFSGLVTLSKNTTLSAASGGTVTFSGDITGSSDITKEGPGKVVFPTAKAHSGAVQVTEGILELDDYIDSSGVTIASGATLQGIGTVSNALIAAGTIAPGNGTGTLTAGDVNLTGTLAVEIDGANFDQLLAFSGTSPTTGSLNITGANLTVTELGGGFTPSGSYVIAKGNSRIGTFASVTPGYAVSYTATEVILTKPSGNDYDTWKSGFGPGFTGTAASSDPDGDGLTNQQEYAFGLNPTLGSSVNPITVPLDKTTGTFTYTRRKLSLVTPLAYTVRTSTDLTVWTAASISGESITTAGDIETVVVTLDVSPPGAPTFFVRVSAE